MSSNSARPSGRYHHGDLKPQLIAGTRRLVEERGPDGFSVAEVARTVGVSSAAPYRHYPDKDALLRAVVVDGMTRLEGAMRGASDAQVPGTLDRVVAVGRAYIDFALGEPSVFRLMFGLTRDHAGDEDVLAQGQRTFEVLLDAIRDVVTGPDAAPERVAGRGLALWSFVHGLSFLTIDEKVLESNYAFDREWMLRDMAERVLGRAGPSD